MWLYFIQIGKKKGPIKIGVATNVEVRLQELQIANPYELKILVKMKCKGKKHAYDMEKFLHRRFKYLRIRGEWFKHDVKDRIKHIVEIPEDMKIYYKGH